MCLLMEYSEYSQFSTWIPGLEVFMMDMWWNIGCGLLVVCFILSLLIGLTKVTLMYACHVNHFFLFAIVVVFRAMLKDC